MSGFSRDETERSNAAGLPLMPELLAKTALEQIRLAYTTSRRKNYITTPLTSQVQWACWGNGQMLQVSIDATVVD